MFKASALASAIALAAAPAAAQTITPTSVTASSTLNTGVYAPSHLIDGSGLSGGTHNADFNAMWASALGVNQAQVTFDLGGVFNLSGADIWNYNWGNPNEFQSTILRGVQDFRILTSLDGISFTEVFAGTLAMGTGQPLVAENFDFTGSGRFVQIDILNNYGLGTYAERDWNSGLSEVRFLGTAVPEPGTWAMMLLGFGAVGFAVRRQKKAIPQIA